MEKYVVNRNAQSTGEHEVHKEGCSFFPDNVIILGEFTDCWKAIEEARKYYTNVDGCYYCCNPCHTR